MIKFIKKLLLSGLIYAMVLILVAYFLNVEELNLFQRLLSVIWSHFAAATAASIVMFFTKV